MTSTSSVAYGGVSILHAAGCGWGCSTPIDLSCKAIINRDKTENHADESGLLSQLSSSILSLTGQEIDSDITISMESEIPASMGLKSSSAVAISAIKSVINEFGIDLNSRQIVEVAAEMQMRSGCSMTGSYDDNWAAMGLNSAIIRLESELPSEPFAHTEINNMYCTIINRGRRRSTPKLSDFEKMRSKFNIAKKSLISGDVIAAFKENGLAVAESTRDLEGLKLLKTLDSMGLASSITGSGPSIAILYEEDQVDLVSEFSRSFERIITTKVLQRPRMGWE
tara:strand:- start:1156 stop:1998 length:843 start_codon:yes stop_codon:yes gene_type:complete